MFDCFKELCKGERMLVGEDVQRLMEACLKAGSVALVLRVEGLVDEGQRKADKLKLGGFIRAVEVGKE